MTNVIELWPGIREREDDPATPALDLSDPLIESDILREVRRYAISVFAKLIPPVSDDDLQRSINVASNIPLILRAIQRARQSRAGMATPATSADDAR